MFETKGMRPYYSIPHIAIAGKMFQELVGIQYRVMDVTSADMGNEGYAEISDMAQATEYFRSFWEDDVRVRALLDDVKKTYVEAVNAETYGWTQDWQSKNISSLRGDMNLFYDLMSRVMVRTIISQPQHVLPLEQKIKSQLKTHPNSDKILTAATRFGGDMPWAEEQEELAICRDQWNAFTEAEKNKKLDLLVKKYGWFNEIEGDLPFDKEHYRKKIEEFEPDAVDDEVVDVPQEIMKTGQLIGELGFLRFWARHHFMSLRYHLKKILAEIATKLEQPDLEYATVEEINEFIQTKKINWKEVRARRDGYVTYLDDSGVAKIVTGKDAELRKQLVQEDLNDQGEIRGVIANKGRIKGVVRVISFTAKDYDEQVAAFRPGEVLVTGMTRPQIVHLCGKAAAIITDEGGITSHAAVVARELNKPCIIATHNATRILKTGDFVEVDANQGCVTRLSQSIVN